MVLRHQRHERLGATPLSQAVVPLFPFECRELFETDHLSNNELGAIVQSVSVVSHEKWLELPAEKRESCFFCDYFFSTKTNYIHPLYGRHFRRFSFQDNTPAKKLERIHLYSYMNPKSSKRDSPAPLTSRKRSRKSGRRRRIDK